MKEYKIKISETLSKIVNVMAETDEEAIDKVKGMYNNETILLDYDDYENVDFEIIEIDKKCDFETVFILKKDTKLTEIDEILKKIKELFNISHTEYVGIKKLAYKIKRNSEGYYMLLNINGYQSFVPELEKYYSKNEKILKYIILKTEK